MAGQFTIQYVLITIIIISMVLTGTTIFMSDVISNYNVTDAQNFTTFSKMEEMQQETRDISTTFQNTSSDQSIIDSTRNIANGVWQTVWLTIDSINIFGTMVTESVTAIPAPTASGEDFSVDWFLPGIIAILTIILIFAIISLVTKTPTL